jgi:hypothetical protein
MSTSVDSSSKAILVIPTLALGGFLFDYVSISEYTCLFVTLAESQVFLETMNDYVNKYMKHSKKFQWLTDIERVNVFDLFTEVHADIPFCFTFRDKNIKLESKGEIACMLCEMTGSEKSLRLCNDIIYHKYVMFINNMSSPIVAQPTESISHKRAADSSEEEGHAAKLNKRVRISNSNQAYELPARPTPEAENPTSPAQADQL